MKKMIFSLIFILVARPLAAAPSPSPKALTPMERQMRSGILVQLQMELGRLQNEFMKKNQQKDQDQARLEQLKGPQQLAKSFAMNSKLTLINHEEESLKAEISQLSLDLKDLDKRQKDLTQQIEKLRI